MNVTEEQLERWHLEHKEIAAILFRDVETIEEARKTGEPLDDDLVNADPDEVRRAAEDFKARASFFWAHLKMLRAVQKHTRPKPRIVTLN